MKSYEVLFSKHTVGKKVYSKGDIVKSESELDKIFVGKFREVEGSTKLVKTPIKPEAEKVRKVVEEEEEEKPVVDPNDVTSEWDLPEGETVRILRGVKKNRFNVVDEDGDILNENELTEKGVQTFLAKYLSEDEE
jgi:hypothetical protein